MKHLRSFFAGEDIFVIGGAVRDRYLGKPVFDIDLALPYSPDKIAKKIADQLKGSFFLMDEERGITRIALENGHQIDLAKRQGRTFEEDVDRRDFSINALAVPLDEWEKPSWKKHIVDRHNGLADLKKKNIRALSPTIFKEDPLRLLRAYRAMAELGFTIDKNTEKLIATHKNRLKKAAPERSHDELLKILASPRAYATLSAMEKSGLLDVFFPEAKRLRASAPNYYGKGGVLKHTLESVLCFERIHESLSSWFPRVHKKIAAYLNEKISNHPRYAHLKWALLLHDIGKPATEKVIDGRLRFFEHEHVGADKIPKMAARYRWSNEEVGRYAKLVRNHMRPGNLASHPQVTDKAIHRFFRDLGDDAIGMLLVSLGDHLTYLTPQQRKRRSSSHEKVTIKMINRYYQAKEKILPAKILNGHDIMNAFHLKPSPQIGELLKQVMEAQAEGKIRTKKDALDYLKRRIPMSTWTIYYNPKCGTCRNTLEILNKKGVKPRIVEYLKNAPSTTEIDAILKKLNMPPSDMVRVKEPIYAELKLGNATLSRAEWLKIIHENPVLIQRPIVVKDNQAVIARPPEKVLDLF